MKLEAFDNLNKVNNILTEKKQNVSETNSSETKENKETKTNETNKKTSKTDSWKKGKTPPKELEQDIKKDYGLEAIFDVHGVETKNKDLEFLKQFAADLCDEIQMKKGPLHSWGSDKELGEYEDPVVDGLSVCQFLYTSSIIIHYIDKEKKLFVNIFSCHKFNVETAEDFILKNWGGKIASKTVLTRR